MVRPYKVGACGAGRRIGAKAARAVGFGLVLGFCFGAAQEDDGLWAGPGFFRGSVFSLWLMGSNGVRVLFKMVTLAKFLCGGCQWQNATHISSCNDARTDSPLITARWHDGKRILWCTEHWSGNFRTTLKHSLIVETQKKISKVSSSAKIYYCITKSMWRPFPKRSMRKWVIEIIQGMLKFLRGARVQNIGLHYMAVWILSSKGTRKKCIHQLVRKNALCIKIWTKFRSGKPICKSLDDTIYSVQMALIRNEPVRSYKIVTIWIFLYKLLYLILQKIIVCLFNFRKFLLRQILWLYHGRKKRVFWRGLRWRKITCKM
jgi:hypothetical protein